MQKIFSLFLALFFFGIFYLFSFVFLSIIDDNTPNFITPLIRGNFNILWIVLTITLTSLYLFLCYKSNKKFNVFSGKLLMVFGFSCMIAGILVFLFGNSSGWFLKYTIGCFVGLLFYLFYQNEITIKLNIISGLVAIFVLLFGEQLEYFILMDPSDYPSILAIRSFPNIIFWFLTILFVFFSSYFFSKGVLIKKLLKKENINNSI